MFLLRSANDHYSSNTKDKPRSKAQVTKTNQQPRRSKAKTTSIAVIMSSTSQSVIMNSQLSVVIMAVLYLMVATLSILSNVQVNGQLYQAPSLAPSATLNNQNIANKHLFSSSNNQQQYSTQESQLLQQNNQNGNQFRPMNAPNSQSSSALKEQLARPSGGIQSLQTAESNQDTYLTNADMNDISDIMRSHYDGSGNTNRKQQQPSNNDNSQNWNNNQQVSANQNGPQQASPSNPAGSATNSGGYYDENDYDDGEASNTPNEGPMTRQPITPAVAPNKRGPQNHQGGAITGSSTNHNHKRNYVNHNNNNDFNSGTDEAYFNRRGPQKSPSLRTEASYNRNHHGGGDDSERSERGRGNNQQESQGFGPGPNEAFMADKNEGSGGGNEQDEDGAYDGPPGGEGSNVDDDGPPQGFGGGPPSGGPDQQSTNQLNYKEPVGPNSGISGNQATNGNGGNDNDDSDIVGDGSGSDIDGADSDFPAGYDPNSVDMDDSPRQPVAAATHQGTTNINQPMRGRISSASASASASAPAPLSAVSPLTMRLQQQRLAGDQRQSLSSSYNPQNNPSHVGKYFIN